MDTGEEFLIRVDDTYHSKTEKSSLYGVNDTGEEFLICVNNTGNACFSGVNKAIEAQK